jgi:membrane-associated phospholipid phosphatase
MPFLMLLVISCLCGLAGRALLARLLPAGGVTDAVAHEAAELSPLRRRLRGRLDPQVATGLALTVAMALLVAGGIVVALLALLLRRSETLVEVDKAAAHWGHVHAGRLSTDGLNAVTQLGNTPLVVVLGATLAIVELARIRDRWLVPFLLVVTIGDSLITNIIKGVVDRARPTLNPAAVTLGPSFPSGHSSTAAAFFAAAALILARRRNRRTRAWLAGAAVALAVAVACSRVLLDLHWLSDVIAGLTLGWAWFAACAIAFGGRMLDFGAPAEKAEREAARPPAELSHSSTR